LVNDAVEMLGVLPLELAPLLELVELEDELPQAARATLAATNKAAIAYLLVSKRI
jgi:hypothetical protein